MPGAYPMSAHSQSEAESAGRRAASPSTHPASRPAALPSAHPVLRPDGDRLFNLLRGLPRLNTKTLFAPAAQLASASEDSAYLTPTSKDGSGAATPPDDSDSSRNGESSHDGDSLSANDSDYDADVEDNGSDTQSPSQSYEDGDASYDADVEDDVSDTELLPTAYGIFCNEHRFIGFDKHDDEPEPEPLPE